MSSGSPFSDAAAGPATPSQRLVWVRQGEFEVTDRECDILTTILGSCIAVCMRDPVARCGGMNHFVLPYKAGPADSLPGLQLRYGSYSIERLVNALLARGARKDRLEIKVFGGANVTQFGCNIGGSNADFVEAYLEREGLRVVARHLRGTSPRKLRYSPLIGTVQMKACHPSTVSPELSREAQLMQSCWSGRRSGGVVLFGGRSCRD